MANTLLDIVQNVCESVGIKSPNSVIGNTDENIVQLLRLANREGVRLARRTSWQELTKHVTFTQAAAASQGTLDSSGILSDDDFGYIVEGSMWNRTTQLPILGNVNSRMWETLQAFPVTGPYQQYRIYGNTLYFDPAGANATDTIAFAYISKFWCESSGGTGQKAWAADTDVPILDDELIELGLEWRWYKAKGLDYAESFNEYEREVINVIGRNDGKTDISLDGSPQHRVPGVMVPQGNWSVS